MGLNIDPEAMGEWVPDFVCTSNRMAGITRDPTAAEISAHRGLLAANTLRVENLELFVHHIAPGARFRGPEGGLGTADEERDVDVRADLAMIVLAARMQLASPERLHRIYGLLRPFTDGNGRCGRVLWMWQTMRATGDAVRGTFGRSLFDAAPPRSYDAALRPRLM